MKIVKKLMTTDYKNIKPTEVFELDGFLYIKCLNNKIRFYEKDALNS